MTTTTSSDFWTRNLPHPTDTALSTITRPNWIGETETGGLSTLNLRDGCVFLWGPQGSGKTVIAGNIIAGALRCDDVLVWTVGDYLARMFMRSSTQGRSALDVPSPIDWVADTSDELITMADTALKIAMVRRSGYTDLRHNANSHATPVGDGTNLPPHILIVIDDDWLIHGLDRGRADDLTRTFEHLTRLVEHGAVSIVFSTLSPYREVFSPEIVDACTSLIGMAITDAGEMVRIFGNTDAEVWPSHKSGCGHASTYRGQQQPYAFRGLHLTPRDADEIGRDTIGRRPTMDQLSRTAAGDAYASRWERMGTRLLP